MLRLPRSVTRLPGQARNILKQNNTRRTMSSAGQSGGGGGKVVAGTLVVGTAVVGGTIGYASVDNDFRKSVESSVPGSADVFQMILGDPPRQPSQPSGGQATPSKLRQLKESIASSPPPEAPKVAVKSSAAMSALPPPPPMEKPPSKTEAAAPKPAADKKAEEKKVTAAPPPPKTDKSKPDTAVLQLCDEMKSQVEAALEEHNDTVQVVVNHINLMQQALEANITTKDDAAWSQVFEAAATKSDALRQAEKKYEQAVSSANKLLDAVAESRSKKGNSSELSSAETLANKALYQLDQAKARINTVQSEAKVVEEYRDLVEEGKQQFQREMASIMPDVKLGELNNKLSEEELNLFISHAYRKVLHLQQELAKLQTVGKQQVKQSLDKQKAETQMMASNKVEIELERQRKELESEHQRRMATVRDESEADLRAQLRRQAAAHSDHIADVLSVQEAELSRRHEQELGERLSEAETHFNDSLARATGTIRGIESALEGRAGAEKKAEAAQKLWLACAALTQAVENADTVKPLQNEISVIKSVVGEDEPMVTAVVSSIPKVALDRGVHSEGSLKDRFCTVERVVNRVALIGDEGGSLLRFGLSYLQSMLLVNVPSNTGDHPIDPENIDVQEIVSRARWHLDRGDLSTSVKLLSLLKGEAGHVASDWVEEARLLLETRQAAQVLMAHAAAVGAQALPQK